MKYLILITVLIFLTQLIASNSWKETSWPSNLNESMGKIVECGEITNLKNSTKIKRIEHLTTIKLEGKLNLRKEEIILEDGLVVKRINDGEKSFTIINCEYDKDNNIVKIKESTNISTVTYTYTYNDKSHLVSSTKIVDLDGEKTTTSTDYKIVYGNNDKAIEVSKNEDGKTSLIFQRIYFDDNLISEKKYSYSSMEDSYHNYIYDDNGRLVEFYYFAKFHIGDIQDEDYKLVSHRVYSIKDEIVTEFYNGEINIKEYFNPKISYESNGLVNNKNRYKYEKYEAGKVVFTKTYDNQENFQKIIKYDKNNNPYCEVIIKTDKNQQKEYIESTTKVLNAISENELAFEEECSPIKGTEFTEFDELGNTIKWSMGIYNEDRFIEDFTVITKYYFE